MEGDCVSLARLECHCHSQTMPFRKNPPQREMEPLKGKHRGQGVHSVLRHSARMKFFVFLLVLVAAEMVVDARPSTLEPTEQIKQAVNSDREKKQLTYGRLNYPGWESESINIDHSSTLIQSQINPRRPHIRPPLVHHTVAVSENHDFNANVRLPHSSLSVGHSESHQHISDGLLG